MTHEYQQKSAIYLNKSHYCHCKMKKALHKMFTWDKWGSLARLQMQCIKTSWALGERHYSGCEKQNPDILLFKEEMDWCYMADNARRTHFALWLFF